LTPLKPLHGRIDLGDGSIDGHPPVPRRLSSLEDCFADRGAFRDAVASADPVVYTVSTVEAADGAGQLHYGVGTIAPGRVGAEYYMTRGHLHAWRAAAELYVGLQGTGHLLLEEEGTGRSRLVPLTPHDVVYVPGDTAHRTINTGSAPLVYLGVYPAAAGHDYRRISGRSFRKVVVARRGKPEMMDREAFLGTSEFVS
jgi:glucose-6-phosphate isomerase